MMPIARPDVATGIASIDSTLFDDRASPHLLACQVEPLRPRFANAVYQTSIWLESWRSSRTGKAAV